MMKTSYKWWSVAGAGGVVALALGILQLMDEADKIIVTERDLNDRLSVFAEEVKPYHEQEQINTYDRKWQRFQYLEYQKCHGRGLDAAEEREFLRLDLELDIHWWGCDD